MTTTRRTIDTCAAPRFESAGGRCPARPLRRMTAIVFLATVALAASIGAGPALAEKRVALVIGNDRYPNLPADQQLRKAVNDARAVGDALEKLGYVVIRGENLDRRGMVDRLFEFTKAVEPGDMALVFYAGHGVAISGGNYLLPTDIPLPKAGEEPRVRNMAIGEADLVAEVQARRARVAVLMIDACRDNPFRQPGLTRTIGASRGLTRAQEAHGVFAIYSAGFGQTALDALSLDDPSPNSVFTRVLVPALAQTGKHLGDLVVDVREKVAKLAASVNHEQYPAYYDQTRGGRVYLAARRIDVQAAARPSTPATAAPTAVAPVARPTVPPTHSAPAKAPEKPQQLASLPPGVTLEPMDGTFYARASGVVVRTGPGRSYGLVRSLNEGEAVRVTGQVAIDDQNPNTVYRFGKTTWFKLTLPDNSQGFANEDEIFNEAALKRKREYLSYLNQLDETSASIKAKASGKFAAYSGMYSLFGCRFDFPKPNRSVPDFIHYLKMSLAGFLYFAGDTAYSANIQKPQTFRTGRVTYFKKWRGIDLYRVKFNEGKLHFVIGMRNGQPMIKAEADFLKKPDLKSMCGDGETLRAEMRDYYSRRITMIPAVASDPN